VEFLVAFSTEGWHIVEQLESDAAESPNIDPCVIPHVFVFELPFQVGIRHLSNDFGCHILVRPAKELFTASRIDIRGHTEIRNLGADFMICTVIK
jgi:hypothetical protein